MSNQSFDESLAGLRKYFMLMKLPEGVELVNSILTELDTRDEKLALSKLECFNLMKFFFDVGYISPEFHSEVLVLIKKIETFLEEKVDNV